MSTLDVINARVVHEAQRELVYSSLSIKQVAAELGFDDEAYFGRFSGSTQDIGRPSFARLQGGSWRVRQSGREARLLQLECCAKTASGS